jgi:protein-disulfide isomerase
LVKGISGEIMAKKQIPETKSKRQQIREQRARKARQQRILIVGGIVAVVVIVVGLVVVPAIARNNSPVGDFTKITPQSLEKTDGLTVGDPNAPVKIEVFEDFKCSACQGYNKNIEPQVISDLVETGKVYYIFRNFPFLDDGSAVKDSDNAANAAMCASEQNRFWDYHHLLFANLNFVQGEFSNKRLVAFADSLGLDTGKFSQCLENRTYKDKIDADLALGKELGVNGTPSLFVNGTILKPGYVPSFEDISAAVEAELAK